MKFFGFFFVDMLLIVGENVEFFIGERVEYLFIYSEVEVMEIYYNIKILIDEIGFLIYKFFFYNKLL